MEAIYEDADVTVVDADGNTVRERSGCGIARLYSQLLPTVSADGSNSESDGNQRLSDSTD